MTTENEETTRADLQRRVKRVESRELSSPEAEALEVPPDRPAVLAPPPVPPPGDGSTPAIDPTLYLTRERRHGHQLIYRGAQVCTAISMVLSMSGIILFLFQEHADALLGFVFGAVAAASAWVGLRLAHRTRLSSRVGGYAVAALVMGLVCLAANLVTYQFREPEAPFGVPKVERR